MKGVVNFPAHAVKKLIPVGVPGVRQSAPKGDPTGNGDRRKIAFKLNHGRDFNAS
jgi:hypothetical protein